MHHILVVEDEPVARRVLQRSLSRRGYQVTAVESAEEALPLLDSQTFDLLLTDIRLPQLDGVALMERARAYDPGLAVVLMSGYASLDSAIAAVRSHAADYIIKPGRPGEIEERIAAALSRRGGELERRLPMRRISESPEAGIVQVGELRIDRRRHQVHRAGQRLPLTRGNFELLAYMAARREQVISTQDLARQLLAFICEPEEARNLVKSRVWDLRQKIEDDPTRPRYLVNVRGLGYMLTAGEAEGEARA